MCGSEHGCATWSEPEMGWGTAKLNLRELFGTGTKCSTPDPHGTGCTSPTPNETGLAGGRLNGEGFMMSVVVGVIVVTLCFF